MQVHDDFPQGSPEWFAIRAGLPTASNFSMMVTPTGKPSKQIDGLAAELAAEMFAGRPLETFDGNRWTDRGKVLEPRARATYELKNETDIVEIGFITNFGAGCSPDGLVDSNGGTEFKCLAAKGHVSALSSIHEGKPPADYVPQVMGSLWITERDWWDMGFFHPDLPWGQIRVYRDEAYIKMLKDQCAAVLDLRDKYLQMLQRIAA